MSLVLNVEILGEFKKLTAATTGAQTDLQKMNRSVATISKRMTAALAAVGVGMSFRWIATELEDASKAAIADAKSQELLALAMRNTGNATDATIAAAEDYIGKMQLSASVADDNLRPAYQKLFIATGNVTESNRLLTIALDASAATGKSLDQVSQAMAKSLAGSDTALLKLIPSLKGSKAPIDDMALAFAGAADKAAQLDPYMRMQIVMDDLKEKIGTALLPVLNQLADYFASPEGQAKLNEFAANVAKAAEKIGDLTSVLVTNGDSVFTWIGIFGGTVATLKIVAATMGIVNGAMSLMATRAALAGAAGTAGATGIGAMGAAAGASATGVNILNGSLTALLFTSRALAALGVLALVLGLSGDTAGAGQTTAPKKPVIPAPITTDQQGLPFVPAPSKTNVGSIIQPGTVNINVNTNNATATDITKALQDWYRATGSTAVLTR